METIPLTPDRLGLVMNLLPILLNKDNIPKFEKMLGEKGPQEEIQGYVTKVHKLPSKRKSELWQADTVHKTGATVPIQIEMGDGGLIATK